MPAALPTVNILIATLNAERYLDSCLRSVRNQDYPQELIEIIVADAGSVDSTLDILSNYQVDQVVPNPGITTESARAILNALASKQLVLYIDCDNYLVGPDWLRQMIRPFADDPTIFAAEPMRFDYQRWDSPLNRYFALSGVNDPVSLFMGNYGRYSHVTGKWTEMPHSEEKRNGYVVVELESGNVPTMGSQGFIVRTTVLREIPPAAYYFDVDAVNELVAAGHNRVAKVDISIGHFFCRDLRSLSRKIRRRAEDFIYWRTRRSYPWLTSHRSDIARFALSTLLVVPLVAQAIRGWMRVHDRAWLYHVPVCWLTLWIYAWSVVRSPLRRSPYSRRGWQH
jgi:glycosyltransferase involved in cell wall biosynthesis